ncbi:MAG: hypothetical protein H6759_02635 [Candidatus Nomurabacteria bacterium]|nr:MAG: hypothetical protein H6759_02635 [Candidatus Nomurabacteria bacterium]
MTSPPEIHQSITDSGDAALRLTNVTNSTFENIFFEDNDYGIAFLVVQTVTRFLLQTSVSITVLMTL